MPRGNNEEVTLALINQKLDYVCAKVDKHESIFGEIREALDGCDEYPGVRGRLQALESFKESTEEPFKSLITFKTRVNTALRCIAAVVVFLGWDYLKRLFVIEVIKP